LNSNFASWDAFQGDRAVGACDSALLKPGGCVAYPNSGLRDGFPPASDYDSNDSSLLRVWLLGAVWISAWRLALVVVIALWLVVTFLGRLLLAGFAVLAGTVLFRCGFLGVVVLRPRTLKHAPSGTGAEQDC
jgi:hypothetical protein